MKRLLFIPLLVLGLGAGGALSFDNLRPPASTVPAATTKAPTVDRIVDGDTIVVSGETVRLLEIDTPETKKPGTPVQCYGPEATEYIKHLLPVGTPVRLEDDVQKRDRYDRRLAYVYRANDNLFVNADIVKNGYGAVYIYKEHGKEVNVRHRVEISGLDAEARSQRKGRWGACPWTPPAPGGS